MAPISTDYVTRAIDALRDRGCKVTAQRKAIANLFGRGHNHWTPQAVFEALHPRVPSLSLATVYNTVEVFEELGLVRRITTRDGCTYFDTHLRDHHHAICDSCGQLIDIVLDSTAMNSLVNQANPPLRIHSTSIWFRGVCDECAPNGD